MDFYDVKYCKKRNGYEIFPDFKVKRSKDLMVRGKSFYAIWDEEVGLWSTDELDVARLVDRELMEMKEQLQKDTGEYVSVKKMDSYSSKSWTEFKNYLNRMPDNSVQLDNKLTFLNTKVARKDYVSRRLPYSLEEGSYDAFDTIIGTLYDPSEREKIEWAIGSIVAGDSKDIQKFIVLYGEAGTGKSTILNIIQKIFEGYYTVFEAKALTSSSNVFSTEVFRNNPLVAVQHDGDLSRIEDNTKLNSIISHEEMVMNEKYKASYMARVNCFLFMGTNKAVKITDAKSGIIRRLIDVSPSGRRLPPRKYQTLMEQIDFELGAIAYHCLRVYRELGKNYYSNYVPFKMMFKTDPFFNFVESNFYEFKEQNGVTLKRAYDMYKDYCEEGLVEYKLAKYKFREELKNYFDDFFETTRVDEKQVRNYYSGFKTSKFSSDEHIEESETPVSLVMDCTESIFDDICKDCLAQYASSNEKPKEKWADVKTCLKQLDTKQLHYVKLPENHIVIDFDLKDEAGKKSFALNLEAASKWIPTYSEVSKGGNGIHLHYIYSGDPKKLSRIYSEGIEIKVFTGNSSLRRKLTKCNNIPIATISSGLPLKGEKKVINFDRVRTEKDIRRGIEMNLRKEVHPGTKPSIDFIFKILEDAYNSGVVYDVTDMRSKILTFAANSTHQSDYCVKLVGKMKFQSEQVADNDVESSENVVFFDVEVFPNLFLINWKYKGPDQKCVRMINPTSKEVEELMKFRLIGFNCRRYDNHILYARYLGYSNEELFKLSQKIVNGSGNSGMFGEAYNISYTDVYDFASAGNKKSLKKFEIELGIHHQELGFPWDQSVPEEKWEQVAEYCDNDVIATEAVFDHLKGDWVARQILAELSGLSVNDTTNQHSTKIIFGNNKHPQSEFIYTDLSNMFPGYKFEKGVSVYKDEVVGEGGYVYAEPGMYWNVALLDVASMHPSSIENLNLFGDRYTKRFSDIKNARLAIKHEDQEKMNFLLDGKLLPFYERAKNGEFSLKDLSNALKTVINSVYGLTSAKFDNAFRDSRNIDNIVAKRGALFMIDLKYAVQKKGFTVAHIKTDSIKIPNATPEIIQFVMDFGKKYGYNFEHEATYDRMCLVNDAVYIARYKKQDGSLGEWTATGAQFAQPYVFKTLFSKESVLFSDMCETKSTTTALYLDMNENYPDVSLYEKEKVIRDKLAKWDPNRDEAKPKNIFPDISDEELENWIREGHNYCFVGKVGSFCPIKDGCGGGLLLREKDGKYYSVTGTKGYRWLESEYVKNFGLEDSIDEDYYKELANDAIEDISIYGDFEQFVADDLSFNVIPWSAPDGALIETCGLDIYPNCVKCEKYDKCNYGYKIPF